MQKGVKLMYKEVCQVRVDTCDATDVIQGKPRKGSDLTPLPRRSRVNPIPGVGGGWVGLKFPRRFFVCHCQTTGDRELTLSDF